MMSFIGKKFFIMGILGLLMSYGLHADTMQHYQNISNGIPKMEMKADSQSQAWARSARNIMLLTGESIAESLISANQMASKLNEPLFCLPDNEKISAEKMNELIEETYKTISGSEAYKQSMSVSEVALQALVKKYPCKRAHAEGFGHQQWGSNQQMVQANT